MRGCQTTVAKSGCQRGHTAKEHVGSVGILAVTRVAGVNHDVSALKLHGRCTDGGVSAEASRRVLISPWFQEAFGLYDWTFRIGDSKVTLGVTESVCPTRAASLPEGSWNRLRPLFDPAEGIWCTPC